MSVSKKELELVRLVAAGELEKAKELRKEIVESKKKRFDRQTLSTLQIRAIADELRDGKLSIKEIALKHGVKYGAVWRIWRGNHSEIAGPIKRPVDSQRKKLSRDDVVKIVKILSTTRVPMGNIAEQFGVGYHAIKDIKSGVTHRDVTGGNPVSRPSGPPPPLPAGDPRRKLTKEDVVRIRELASEKVPRQEIADTFGVSLSHVGKIVERRRWRNV